MSFNKPKTPVKPLLASKKNAAAMLDCCEDKVDELIALGKLEAVRLGPQKVSIKMSSIERVAEEGVR